MNQKVTFGHDSSAWLKGYDDYIKLYRRTRLIITAAVFLVIGALFVEQIVRDPSYGVGWFCLAICIFIIAVNVMSPIVQKRKIASALDEIKDDRYILNIYDDRYVVETILPQRETVVEAVSDEEGADGSKTQVTEVAVSSASPDENQIPPTETMLADKSLKAVERNDYFGLYSAKTFCVIPKSSLSDEGREAVSELVRKINESGKNKSKERDYICSQKTKRLS